MYNVKVICTLSYPLISLIERQLKFLQSDVLLSNFEKQKTSFDGSDLKIFCRGLQSPNYSFCRLKLVLKILELYEPTNQNSRNITQRIRKFYYKTLGTSVINSPMSHPSLGFFTKKVSMAVIDTG